MDTLNARHSVIKTSDRVQWHCVPYDEDGSLPPPFLIILQV
jgi:hypothetical protein